MSRGLPCGRQGTVKFEFKSPSVHSVVRGHPTAKRLFLDSVIEVAKKELRWECDYIREAECTKRFKELVKPHPDFYVPEVIPELSTPQGEFHRTLLHSQPSLGTVDKLECTNIATHRKLAALIITEELIDNPENIIN
ncbi:Atypical kinase ADCK3, mitochondrial [Portunus trituberculatus]|uniref:Atypical kinase ADCK3, mitochondrial n=1 Tax=Portunus trituberculatus TaxID=210409 RepID=A0A5B7H216_PORTR|nr:Atypical kinase ADCK3, mitochondrial [Portunus trituberculatus]